MLGVAYHAAPSKKYAFSPFISLLYSEVIDVEKKQDAELKFNSPI